MFDVALEDKLRHSWHVDLPIEAKPWRIGAIIGPSGSGKSTIGRALFGPGAYHEGYSWPDGSILDGFPEAAGAHEITTALSSVGFASPPGWVKPYRVLSNGEKFRAELARLLLDERPLVVVDEFTSVVDRTAAKIGSAAVAKTLRRQESTRQLVVLSCHYDILEWLAPDWTFDLRTGEFQWARLQRPSITIDLFRIERSAWRIFAPHHYLSATVSRSATCYGGYWGDELIAFVAVLPSAGHRGMRRESRIVVLPDYQGLGIGNAVAEAVATLWLEQGYRYSTTTSHPARIAYLARSPRWAIRSILKHGSARNTDPGRRHGESAGRAVVAAEFLGK